MILKLPKFERASLTQNARSKLIMFKFSQLNNLANYVATILKINRIHPYFQLIPLNLAPNALCEYCRY